MPDFLSGIPFAVALTVLSVGGWLRGQLMYWVGRLPTDQALRRTNPSGRMGKLHSWLEGGGADAGINAIRRWGLIMVPLCYVTVGFQSMVQAGAGVLRIKWWKYALAQIPGAIAWGAIYSTIGFAVWKAALAAAAGSKAGIIVIALAAAAAVVVLVRVRAKRKNSLDRGQRIPSSQDGQEVASARR